MSSVTPTTEFAVAIFGYPPSFNPTGPMMAMVQAAPGSVLIDRERGRARVDTIPTSRDLDKWSSPTGLILAARRGEWGLSIVEDHYRGIEPPPLLRSAATLTRRPRAQREAAPVKGRYRRASLPADLCSCFRCRDLVIARRDPETGRAAGLTAPGRLWRGAFEACGGLSGCQGPGAANVLHGRDCAAFDLGRSGPIVRSRRARAGLLNQLLNRLAADPIGELLLSPAVA